MIDSATGLDRAPHRYTAHGRETCDRMRDQCRRLAREFVLQAGGDPQDVDLVARADALGDFMFAAACDTHAMKYDDRRGLKGDPEEDRVKAHFWHQMAAHVRDPSRHPDPRCGRPDHRAYEPLDDVG